MKNATKNKLAMYKTVRDTVIANGTIWGGIPAFVSQVDSLQNMILQLEELEQEQSLAIVGVRSAKDNLREMRNDTLLRFSGALTALAKDSGNVILKEQMKFKKSRLSLGSRQEYLSLVDRIVTAAQNHSGELADYGITPAELAQLPVIRQELETGIMSTRMATISRKEYTLNIALLVKEIDDLLKNGLDQLVKMLKGTHSGFYSTYNSARLVIDYGHHNSNPNSI